MKKILTLALFIPVITLSGCGKDETISPASPTAYSATPTAPIPANVPLNPADPLVELLSETPSEKYLLEKADFLAKAKQANGIIIDLRTGEEIKKLAKIDPSAKELDVLTGNAVPEFFRTADKSKTYFIYDSNGSRSDNVYNALKKSGFSSVFVLRGGIGEAK